MSLNNKLRTAVIGATGFTGLDLVYLLSKHPKVNIVNLCATKNLGKKIHHFDKRLNKNLPKLTSIKKIDWEKLDLVFLSLPNGEAQEISKFLLRKNTLIDLAADFRLSKSSEYLKWYKLKHKSYKNIKKSIYALPEIIGKKVKSFN